MVWVSIIFGAMSAVAWFGAAVIPPAKIGAVLNLAHKRTGSPAGS